MLLMKLLVLLVLLVLVVLLLVTPMVLLLLVSMNMTFLVSPVLLFPQPVKTFMFPSSLSGNRTILVEHSPSMFGHRRGYEPLTGAALASFSRENELTTLLVDDDDVDEVDDDEGDEVDDDDGDDEVDDA